MLFNYTSSVLLDCLSSPSQLSVMYLFYGTVGAEPYPEILPEDSLPDILDKMLANPVTGVIRLTGVITPSDSGKFIGVSSQSEFIQGIPFSDGVRVFAQALGSPASVPSGDRLVCYEELTVPVIKAAGADVVATMEVAI